MIEFFVHGIPRPQGSKRGFYRNGRVVLVEASKQLPEWREQIVLAAKEAMMSTDLWYKTEKPVRVECVFFFPKPKTVKRDYPSVAPDLDKLCRSLLDALTQAGVYLDDAQVIDLIATKRYSASPGVSVMVSEL
jgi:Holliday junction resolvase RusA-like endonuclease